MQGAEGQLGSNVGKWIPGCLTIAGAAGGRSKISCFCALEASALLLESRAFTSTMR